MSDASAPSKITSAIEFYERWPSLRHRAERLVEACEATPQDAELLEWMIKVIDMVGPNDLSDEK
jgi:hypothetical protein